MATKEQIKKDYQTGKYTFNQLSEKYNISQGTIKSWAKRDKDNGKPWLKWGRKKAATKQKTKNKKVADGKKVASNHESNKNNREMEEYKLTERQRTFAEIYVRTPIAYKAAIKAGYSPDSAFVEGSTLLRNPKVKAYIDYLKELKRQAINLDVEDLVDLNMRIAFGDIKDYTEFGQERVPVMSKGVPVVMENPVTGEKEILTKRVNTIKLKEDYEVDGEIISEIKTSRQGTSIKLHDKMKAIQWLTDYFGWNPESKHKKEFDEKKIEFEKEKFEHQKDVDDKRYW